MGKSNCEKNIYVSKENKLKALELINNIKLQENNLDIDKNTNEDKNKINTSKIIATILIAMMIMPILVTISYQIINWF